MTLQSIRSGPGALCVAVALSSSAAFAVAENATCCSLQKVGTCVRLGWTYVP